MQDLPQGRLMLRISVAPNSRQILITCSASGTRYENTLPFNLQTRLWRRCAKRDWQPACPTPVQSRVSVEAIPSFASSCASSVARATKRECLEKSDQGCGAARVQQNMNLLADVEDNAGVVPASDRVRSPSDLVDYHLRTFGATRQGRRD